MPSRAFEPPLRKKMRRYNTRAVGVVFSECILQRRIDELAIAVAARLFDKSSGGEKAVACVALQMAGEVVSREQVRLRADVERPGAGSRPEHGGGFIEDAITIGRPPKQVLLERERKIAYRGYGNAGIRTNDVLPPDVVDVAEI